MILKAEITIDINTYENVKPIIEIDTEKLDEAVKLIQTLHAKFHRCCSEQHTSTIEKVRAGIPIPVEEFETAVSNGQGVAINDAKKEFKRKVAHQIKKDKEFFNN